MEFLTLQKVPLKLKWIHADFVLELKLNSSGEGVAYHLCVQHKGPPHLSGGLQLLQQAGEGHKPPAATAHSNHLHGHGSPTSVGTQLAGLCLNNLE